MRTLDSRRVSSRLAPATLSIVAAFATAPISSGQELPLTGAAGVDLVWASSPGDFSSQLFAVAPTISSAPLPISNLVPVRPSKWAHRRRTLGGMETAITLAESAVLFTPLGSAPGNAALHVLDARALPPVEMLIATANPAAYDVAACESLDFVFTAEDDGAGGTKLRGWSYAAIGSVTPLSPATLTLPGAPAAYVNRIGVDEQGKTLHVATADGFFVVQLDASVPQMGLATSIPTAPLAPATNPSSVVVGGVRHWIAGTLDYPTGASEVVDAGWTAWTAAGPIGAASFGIVPSVPTQNWVPAAGAHEVAVVSNGSAAYAYFLLREPKPSTFFVKSAAVGCVKLATGAAPTAGTLLCPDPCGEPFAIPTSFANRVAFETSFGPPFVVDPPDGGERLCLIYSPLDPEWSGSGAFGDMVVPGPLGGRISTKGMDRPIWTRDGSRVVAATSHFAGTANPGLPGIEVLNVPASVQVTAFQSPHTVVPNPTFPKQSIIHPSLLQPRNPGAAAFLGGLSFAGNVFHDGMASICVSQFGEIGQKQLEPANLPLPAAVPGFPSILTPAFFDATGPTLQPPSTFGARRTTWNVLPGMGLSGVVMYAASLNRVLMQPTGFNVLASLGLIPPQPRVVFVLPTGWTTSSELLSF